MNVRKSQAVTRKNECDIEPVSEYSIRNKRTARSQAYKRAITAIVVLALLMFGAGMKYARYLEGKPLADVAVAGTITQTESFDEAASSSDVVVLVEGCAEKTGYFSAGGSTSLRELVEYIGVTADGDVSDFDFNHKMQTGDIYYIKSKNNPVDVRPWLDHDQVTDDQSGEQAAGSADDSSSASSGEKINLNTATAEQLMQLDGIGESKSQAIIDHREKHGGFKRIEDILAVKGIGDKTYAGFKDRITVE